MRQSIALTALREQVAVMAGLAASPDIKARLHRPSPWVRGRLAIVTRPNGSWRTCRHYRPTEVGWLLMWHQREVVCSRCSLALHESVQGTVGDHECDVCGKITGKKVFPFALPLAAGLVAVGGCCRDCRPVVHPEWGDE